MSFEYFDLLINPDKKTEEDTHAPPDLLVTLVEKTHNELEYYNVSETRILAPGVSRPSALKSYVEEFGERNSLIY